jgi:hypothetical protein
VFEVAMMMIAMAPAAATSARHLSGEELVGLVEAARQHGQLGEARKSRPVDARPARQGEIIVTVIAGEGVETRSRPAQEGDWVVRNRCPETGNEQYLVSRETFAERYSVQAASVEGDGWREARPRGKTLHYFVLTPAHGAFTFDAPWGEAMVARPGDAIVQDPDKPDDIYRVAAASFRCSYEVVE